MSYGDYIAPAVVFGVIASISSAALSTEAKRSHGEIIFPAAWSGKVMGVIGGAVCFAFGTYGLFTHMGLIFSVSFVLLGSMTPFFPLRAIILSPSGVEGQGIVWWKTRTFRWNEIDRVEVWKGGRMVALVHGKSTIAHTRFHVDQDEFVRQVKLHVPSSKWVKRGLR